MPASVMPAGLNDRLSAVAAVVRRNRLIRGVGRTAVVAVLAGLSAVLLDASFEFTRPARGVLFAGWLTVCGWAAWRLLVRPLRRPVKDGELAAVVETYFPTLAERLSTLVTLNEHADPSNGSRQLIAYLARETAQRSKRLNFQRAVPRGRAVRTGLLSAAVVLLVLSPMLFVTGASERVRRILLPWYAPAVHVPFRIVVTSGHPVLKRGDSVTLSAYLERTREDGVLPDSATLLYRESGQSAEKKLPMPGDDKAVFSVVRPGVTEGFEYAIEVGPLRTDWYRVIAADPVDLAEGTAVVVTAPEYARAALPEKTLLGFGEFAGLERSTVTLDLRFNRRAETAALEWKPGGKPAGFRPIPLDVAADHLSAKAQFSIREDGTLRLVLSGEHGITTDYAVTVLATKDKPPVFEKVVGISNQPVEVRPVEKFPIEFSVSDDIAISTARIEYAVGNPDAIPRTETVQLTGADTPEASVKTVFTLDNKVRDGETIYLRIRAFDNRVVPEDKLQPQESVYPATGWMPVKVNSSARPLAEQQIFGQRDRIREKLQAAVNALSDATREVARVRSESAGRSALTDDHQARLSNTAEKVRDARQNLDDAAREAAVVPGLRDVATEARKIADDPVQTAGNAARKANNEPNPAERDRQLGAAATGFEQAVERTKKLIERNDALARARLAPRAFEELAAEVGKLAAEAKQIVDRPGRAEELSGKEQKLEADLARAVENSPELKRAETARAGEAVRKLANDADRLLADHEALREARAVTEKANREKQNASFAERQRKLADDAAGLADKARTAAKVAGTDPLDRKPFEDAADALQKNTPIPAMTEQEKAARALDKLAAAMEQAASARGDARETARQLAKWQEDLKQRVTELTRNDSFDSLPPHARDRVRKEQEDLAKAAAGLSVPPGDDASTKAWKEAVDRLEKAKAALEGRDNAPAKAMQAAADALTELAKTVPDRQQRLKSSRAELNKVLDEQAAVTRQAEAALRTADKSGATPEARESLARKLESAARKQDELAKRVKDLDLPGLEGRRQRAVESAGRAGEDLHAGLPQDIPASQKDLGRQLDRLKQAIDGQTPADDLADRLARRQRELAAEFAKPGGAPLPRDLEKLQRLQREVNKDLSGLSTPEAPDLANRAKDAAQALEQALRIPEDVDELKKKSETAADLMEKLADRMAGAESDAARIDRLRGNREAAAEKVRQQSGKPVDAAAGAEAQKQAQQDLDELEQTRVGAAQSAKQKASDELQKLARSTGPDRQPAQQQAAAAALAELARQMSQNRDRTDSQPRPDRTAGGHDDPSGLPSHEKASRARQLAREQRELRNQLSQATAKAGRGRTDGDPGRLEQLEKRQAQVANEAEQLARDASGVAAGNQARTAAEAAEKAAGQLAAGNPDGAKESSERAARALKEAAKAGAGSQAGQKAASLAEKQDALAKAIAREAADADAASAKQARREKELADRSGQLSDAIGTAAGHPSTGEKSADLRAAAEAARDAQRQLDRAAGESAAGRQASTDEARRAADAAVRKARDLTARAAGTKPGDGKPGPGEPNPAGETGADAKAALDAVDEAARAMRQARTELGKGNGAGAGGQMEKAEKALNDAAKNLNPDRGRDGEAKSGGGSGGEKPGGNDGTGEAPLSPGDLPPDLKEYAGKAWGDLPGDVQTRIIQDLRAKYGEDYARIIKLYFTEVANRK